MIKMYKTLIFLAYLVLSDAQNDGSLDSILKKVFDNSNSNLNGVPKSTQPPAPSRGVKCTTANNKAGECVMYYLCIDEEISSDGRNNIDVRINMCESSLEVCCAIPEKKYPEDTTSPPPIIQQKGCGWRNPNGVGIRTTRDVNHDTKFGEFPWMVAILRLEPVSPEDPNSEILNIYVAGGSLIHPSVVMTVAHYFDKRQELKARAGEWDTQTVNEIYPFQDRDVSEVVVHKDFNKHTLYYDVALLFLAAPMSLAPNVGLACLAPLRQRVARGTPCLASGWGKDKFGARGYYQVILKRVELSVVDHNTCEKALRNTRLGTFFELHTSFMCAGGSNGQDTCSGDGGSPLVCPVEFEQNRYEQAGIVSWGIGCGNDGTPGVYTDVASVRDWIDNQVAGHNYDQTVYKA